MIATLIAAVIAQPLDASYSTAGHPKNCGVNVTVRHPASWRVVAAKEPTALADILTASADAQFSVWISDKDFNWPAPTMQERAHEEMYRDALWQVLEEYVPEAPAYSRSATRIDNLPAAIIEFQAPSFRGYVAACVYDRRLVMLWANCRGESATRFDEFAPTFRDMLASVTMDHDTPPLPIGRIAAGIGLCVVIAGFAVHRLWFTSSKGSRLSPGRPDRRRSRPSR